MYEIIKVGIPLQSKDITNEFIKIVEEIKNSKECIAVTTVDYWQGEIDYAPGGNYYLLKNLEFKPYIDEINLNCINTLGSVWEPNRNLSKTVKKILAIFDSTYEILKFKRIYIFAGGSPLCGDYITTLLQKYRPDTKIVDTKSCIQIALEALKLNTKYNDVDFVQQIQKNEYYVDTEKINVFLCLQKWYEYNGIHTMQKFFTEMKNYYNDDDIFYSVNIEDSICNIFTTSFKEAQFYTEEIYTNNKALIILLQKKGS